MKNCAVYSRVSSEEQKTNFSLASQRRGCERLAKEHGYSIAAVFEDAGFSGSEFDRPALSRMRDAIRSGTIQVVIVFDPDRLTRSLSHLLGAGG